MKGDYLIDEWKVIEEGFRPGQNRVSESIFSLGNGRMGLRGNFEEHYSGDSLQGQYVGGIYYADYQPLAHLHDNQPRQIVKFLNAPNWIGISISFDGEVLDLATCQIKSFRRELDLRRGFLDRTFVVKMKSGRKVRVSTRRFCSMEDDQIGAIRYTVTPVDFDCTLTIQPYIDADVSNEDADNHQKYWLEVGAKMRRRRGYLLTETKKTGLQVCTAMKFSIYRGKEEIDFNAYRLQREKFIGGEVDMGCRKGEQITVFKFASVVTSLEFPDQDLPEIAEKSVKKAFKKGFDQLAEAHFKAWEKRWKVSDIEITGAPEAQQAIRFNIFQLIQAYKGTDSRIGLASVGFTGERYAGCTNWDAEAYCLPFFLCNAPAEVSRNLLEFRHRYLPQAIANAKRSGFSNGAAFYPMITINGEEAHHRWEITLEEIHRNGAIAYAIFDYIRYTGDANFLEKAGLEMLIAIARYWVQRVHFSERQGKYMIHGVTGPNEYENNINNNWYTNYLARWCLQYTIDAVSFVKSGNKDALKKLAKKIGFREGQETQHWTEIIKKMYLPGDRKLGIFVQHDTFLDKHLATVADLDEKERPLYKNWTWDRILRSVYLKQADVLQGMYFFEDTFDRETIAANFAFYEPRTVHESPLSPCVHSILAARLNQEEKAYELYRSSARVDLDNLFGETGRGLHVTTMGASWMALVKGFGGMRISKDGRLHVSPILPAAWKGYTFRVNFREKLLEVRITTEQVVVINRSSTPIEFELYDQHLTLEGGRKEKINR